MKTKEIVNALFKNQMIRTSIPEWAHATIPYPFYRNGIPCLGFYFYPTEKTENKRLIKSPVTQVITVYPNGHIVSITASPFFLNNTNNSDEALGEYPNQTLKALSVEEGNVLYDEYYAACDNFFETKQVDHWKNCFEKVKEEGMDKYFALLASQEVKVTTQKTANPPQNTFSSPEPASQKKTNFISAKLQHSLRDIQNFLKKPVFSENAAALAKIINDSKRDAYEIAVIGEFSRGKTTFLNDLFRIDCLPVGNLPTTAVLTRINNNDTASAVFIDKNRNQSKLEFTSDALEDYIADTQGNDPEGVLQITVPMNWLENKNIVFYDTPGAGDIIGKRADLTRNVINHCDCTIMAISAQAACSITEMEFLRANVILKAIPKCIILITKLDTIPENERMGVLSLIKNKIGKILPTAQYWVAQEMAGIDCNELNAYGIDAIRSAVVNQYSSDEEAAKLREKQLAARVQMVLEEAKNNIKIIEDAEKLSEEQKCEAIKKLEYHKDHLDLIGQELEVKCDSMRHTVEHEIISDLAEVQKNILTDCQMSLQKTTMTKEWVERDFPYMLEKALKPIVGRMEKKIITSISVARTNLAEVVKKQFSDSGIIISLPTYETITIDSDLAFTPENIEKTKLISRCASIITLPVALFVLGPFGALVGGGIGLGSELFLKKKIEDQKKLIAEQINLHIEKLFNDIQKHLLAYIGKCHTELLENIAKETQKAVAKTIEKINDANHEKCNTPKESLELHEKLNQLIANMKNF